MLLDGPRNWLLRGHMRPLLTVAAALDRTSPIRHTPAAKLLTVKLELVPQLAKPDKLLGRQHTPHGELIHKTKSRNRVLGGIDL